MTETTKHKILQILGDFAMDELGIDGLLNVLSARLKSQQETIEKLRGENAAERSRLHQDTEILHREIHEVRKNPNSLLSITNYFICQNGNAIEVNLERGQLYVFEYIGKAKVKYAMEQISPEQAFK